MFRLLKPYAYGLAVGLLVALLAALAWQHVRIGSLATQAAQALQAAQDYKQALGESEREIAALHEEGKRLQGLYSEHAKRLQQVQRELYDSRGKLDELERRDSEVSAWANTHLPDAVWCELRAPVAGAGSDADGICIPAD